MKQSKIRVLVVEDDPILLDCLQLEIAHAPSLRCVGAFASFEEAREAIPRKLPDVILMDLGLPGGVDGTSATRDVRRRWPRIKVIVFTNTSDEARIYAAFSAGANGFLVKSGTRDELISGIECAYEGGSPISAAVGAAFVSFFARRQSLMPHLSPTEKLILEEFDRGVAQKEIAEHFGMSMGTLRTHANRILEKTGVRSLVRAAHLLRRHALD